MDQPCAAGGEALTASVAAASTEWQWQWQPVDAAGSGCALHELQKTESSVTPAHTKKSPRGMRPEATKWCSGSWLESKQLQMLQL